MCVVVRKVLHNMKWAVFTLFDYKYVHTYMDKGLGETYKGLVNNQGGGGGYKTVWGGGGQVKFYSYKKGGPKSFVSPTPAEGGGARKVLRFNAGY